MAAANQERTTGVSSPPDTATGRVVIFGTPDVLATIGRPGLLEARLGAGSIERENPCRSDVLLQNLRQIGPPPEVDLPSSLNRTSKAWADDPDVKVVVFSLEPDLVGPTPLQHIESGWLIQPPADIVQEWPQDAVAWLGEQFQPAPGLTAKQTLDNLSEAVQLLSSENRAVFIFNVSTFDPGDQTHSYKGVADTFEVRAHRLVAGLERVAGDLGVAIIDVDGAVAEVGAVGNVPAPARLTGSAAEFVTEEAVLAIDQSGALGGTLQAPVMRLRVPSFDRRTTDGVIADWHIGPGDSVTDGDVMFEVRFETRVHRFDLAGEEGVAAHSRRVARSQQAKVIQVFNVSVVAGSDAFIHDILVPAGSSVSAGDVAAIVTAEPAVGVTIDDATADFRVGARVVGQ